MDGTLSVSIPSAVPLRPLLGGKVVVPCYFQDNTPSDPGAPTIAPLSHRIKWSFVTKENVTTILVASEGKVHVEREYLDRVTMVNYPLVSTDASLEITELRSKDSGTYRCEVMHGIEDNYDTVDIQVQGMTCRHNLTSLSNEIGLDLFPSSITVWISSDVNVLYQVAVKCECKAFGMNLGICKSETTYWLICIPTLTFGYEFSVGVKRR